ncbi:MAG: hypothetical protein K1X28_01460 [Parachlamydiales bacterium]|nr:hypothetical protein [Parachlamydiales bacterium]
MKKLMLILIFMFGLVYAIDEHVDVSQPLRINQLVPREKFFVALGVEPAIPKDFVAIPDNDEIPNWIYWGPKEVVTGYLEDPESLSMPILGFKVAPFAQDENYFNEQKFKEANKDSIASNEIDSIQTGSWGSYPYLAAKIMIGAEKQRLAWVGLNAENGTVFLFKLLEPKNKGDKKEGERLWKTFLTRTQQLSLPLLFKAQGQEMHYGYTIVDVLGRKIKVMAEKRKSDRKYQFVVIPSDENVKFEYKKAFTCFMEPDWHQGSLLMKVEGSYIIDNGWVHNFMTTSILVKEVDEFTDTSKLPENGFVKQL